MFLRLSLIFAFSILSGFAFADGDAGFTMHFTFKTPYSAIAGSTAGMWLDVCDDNDCVSVDSSIPLECQARNTPDPETVDITDCAVHATNTEDPDSDFYPLNHPVTLRIRIDHMMSPPFRFGGGKEAFPSKIYRLIIENKADELLVIPQSY